MYNEEFGLEYYKSIAEKLKDAKNSTAPDDYVKDKELELIQKFVFRENKVDNVLDIGCGNGAPCGIKPFL